MPAEWRNVPVVNLSDAINLLAKYQPNRGKDIADLGAAITKQANMYPLQIQAQAEAQAKTAEANKKNQEMFDALRLSNYMRENRDQIDAILKASFNGSEGYASAIDDPTIDAFAKDAILKRASEQLSIGDTSRERKAKAEEAKLRGQEALATIGLRNMQTLKAQYDVKDAENKWRVTAGEQELSRWAMEHPDEANAVFDKLTSDNKEQQQQAYAALGSIGNLNPFETQAWFTKLKQALPNDNSALETYKANAERVQKQVQNTLDNTIIPGTPLTLGALQRVLTGGIPSEGITIAGQHISGQTLAEMLKDPNVARVAQEEMDILTNGDTLGFGKAANLSPVMNQDFIKALIPYFLENASTFNIPLPQDSFNEKWDINQKRDWLNQLIHGGNQAGLRKAVQQLNEALIGNEKLLSALNTETGVLSRIKAVLDTQYSKRMKRWSMNKKPEDLSELRNEALPYIRQYLKDYGIPEEYASQILSLYERGLLGQYSPITFSLKKQPSK